MIELKIDASVLKAWSGETILASFFMGEYNKNQTDKKRITEIIDSEISNLKKKGNAIHENPSILRMRRTFRAMPNMDPLRYRPASEALIRRCLNKGFFQINPLVDINNLLSIRFRVPLGIYDIDKVASTSWTYRIGLPSEDYYTISKHSKKAEGKLVLADSVGIIGSPITDSGRANISEETNRVLVVIFLPFEATQSEPEQIVSNVEGLFYALFSPKEARCQIIS